MGIDVKALWKCFKDKSGTICAIGAVIGLGVTTYLSGKAAVDIYEKKQNDEVPEDTKGKIKMYGKAYLKTGISFAATTGLIIGSDRIHVGKEVAIAGIAAAYKDRFLSLEEKLKEKVDKEVVDSIHEELANEAAEKDAANGFKNVKLNPDEFIVYVPSAEQYYITTEEKIKYARFRAEEELRNLHDVRLSYFVRKLGRPVSGRYNPLLDDIGWRLDNADQYYQWEMAGPGVPKIDYVRNAYVRVTENLNGKAFLQNYLRDDEQIKDGDIRALFFTVEPETQRWEDRL